MAPKNDLRFDVKVRRRPELSPRVRDRRPAGAGGPTQTCAPDAIARVRGDSAERRRFGGRTAAVAAADRSGAGSTVSAFSSRRRLRGSGFIGSDDQWGPVWAAEDPTPRSGQTGISKVRERSRQHSRRFHFQMRRDADAATVYEQHHCRHRFSFSCCPPPPRAGVTRSNLAASMGHVPRNGPIGMRVGSNQGFGHQVSWLAGAHSHTPPRPVEIVDLAAVSRVGNKILGRSTPLNRPDQFDGLATVHRRFLAARPGLNEHASPIATTKMAAARRRCTARSPASSASRAAIDPRRPAPQ